MLEKKSCGFIEYIPQSLSDQLNEQLPDSRIKKQLEREIKRLIEEEEMTHFICGMALGVEQWAAEVVIELKNFYPQITLECVLSYETQAEKWAESQREQYFNIIAKCDKETLLQNNYALDCMKKQNQYILEHSDVIVIIYK